MTLRKIIKRQIYTLLDIKHSGRHEMLSKDDDATALRSAELTFRTRIKIPCSPRLWCGLLLWEAGIMTRVTQTIYNPGRAVLWLVTLCSPGLWLAGQAAPSPQQTVFRINHHPNTKIYLRRKIETSLLKYMNEKIFSEVILYLESWVVWKIQLK